jgi:cytochrome c
MPVRISPVVFVTSILSLAAQTCGAARGGGPSADAARGKTLYETRCVACHSVDSNRVGPAHRGVYGRRAGSAPAYDYSASLRNSRIQWNAKTLNRWLTSPEALIPGQKMGYSVPDATDRADLIAYLKSVSR